MPKRLRIWPNERLDIVDLERAANDLTVETAAQLMERLLLQHRSQFLEGFRISITGNQVTVYNGTAFDRDGNVLFDEEQFNVGKTITLSGSSTTYYLELEVSTTETDTDSRAFWDPTFDNGPSVDDGKEFDINVATRIQPSWSIVSPPSTTAFEVDSDPNSNKIPLAILVTDGTGSNIVGPASLSLGAPATVLVEDASAGATSVRVHNARILPAVGNNINVNLAENVTVSSIDRANGIIEFAPALSFSYTAGAIVSDAANSNFVVQRKDPKPVATHPDQQRRLFQADEIRGSGLLKDKDDISTGVRSDLNIESLKDYVDYLSAQIREMKWGTPRTDTDDLNPLFSGYGSSTRWYDLTRGIEPTRAVSVTVGIGSNESYGDFNGTDEVPFQRALTFIGAKGGGRIYVKPGTYTFTSPLDVDEIVEIVGDPGSVTINGSATGCFNIVSGGTEVSFVGLNLLRDGSSDDVFTANAVTSKVTVDRCTVSGGIFYNSTSADISLRVYNSTIAQPANASALFGSLVDGVVRDSSLSASGTNSGLFTDSISDFSLQDCEVLCNRFFLPDFSGTNFVVKRNRITTDGAGGAAAVPVLNLPNASTVVIEDNVFELGRTATSEVSADRIIEIDNEAASDASYSLTVKNNVFRANSIYAFAVSVKEQTGNPSAIDLDVVGNKFEGIYRCLSVVGSDVTFGRLQFSDNLVDNTSVASSSTLDAVYLTSADADSVLISRNQFSNFTASNLARAVYISAGTVGQVSVLNNSFVDFAASSVDCVYVDAADCSANVLGNTFSDFTNSDASGSFEIVTVDVDNSVVSDNVFTSIVKALAGSSSWCIKVGGSSVASAVVKGNSIRQFNGGDVDGAIVIDSIRKASVVGNVLYDLTCDYGIVYGAVVTPVNSTNLSMVLSDNTFYLDGVESAIYVSNPSASNEFKSLVVNGNSIQSDGSYNYGIRVECVGVASRVDSCTISGNSIEFVPFADETSRAISFAGNSTSRSEILSISGNSVNCLDVNANSGIIRNLIHVTFANRVSISGNSLYSATDSGVDDSVLSLWTTLAFIIVRTCDTVSVVGNSVDAAASHPDFSALTMYQGTYAAISGNTLVTNAASSGLAVYANTFSTGICVGNVAIGGITLSSSAWQFGDSGDLTPPGNNYT